MITVVFESDTEILVLPLALMKLFDKNTMKAWGANFAEFENGYWVLRDYPLNKYNRMKIVL